MGESIDLKTLNNDEVNEIWQQLTDKLIDSKRENNPVDKVIKAAILVLEEFKRRGMDVEPNELTSAVEEFKGPLTPTGVKVAFVGACPTPIEAARREPFISDNGLTLRKQYLEPLGLRREDVALLNVVPAVLKDEDGKLRMPTGDEIEFWREHTEKRLEEANPSIVVAFGVVAKSALGDKADFAMPHPAAIRRFGDSGEVFRKIRQIRQAISKQEILDDRSSKGGYLSQSDSDDISVPIIKADQDKKIVYGVVLDPYQVDAHGDYISPKEIEQTAHKWMAKSRLISLDHKSEANAKPVESWVEQYPSTKDYKAAIVGKPHRVFRREFGKDVIHSGAWVLGTQLDDELWESFQTGKIAAYSIEGFGARLPTTRDALPDVKFVDLISAAPTKNNQGYS
jgi:uracil-DNA glycosylase family 4